MQNVLITGVNGFVGRHATAEFLDNDYNVIGVGRESQPHPNLMGLKEYIVCDLADTKSIAMLSPKLHSVDAVIHLAGIATTNNTPEQAASILRINAEVHRVLYQALLDIKSRARIIAVSTGLLYDQNQAMPLTENSLLMPNVEATNAYIRSKLLVEDFAKQYREKGLDIVVARPFNHTGPGQGLGFFVPDQIAKITTSKKTGEHMNLGNGLDFWRDFTDVRDVVRAYHLLAAKDGLEANTFNIASGVPIFGRDLFRMIAAEIHFDNYTLTTDGPSVNSVQIYGDAGLLQSSTLWQTQINLQQTIHDSVGPNNI